MSTPDEQALAELEVDICHLFHLLDTLCDMQFNVHDRERCDAILWVTREHARKIKRDAHAAIWPDDEQERPMRMTGDVRS